MPSDFVLKPDFDVVDEPEYSTIITEFENGYEQRRNKWGAVRYKWTLQYVNRSSADRDTILTLFNAKKGRATSFTWDHPVSGTTYTVRFIEDSLKIQNTSYGIYNISFQLQQVK